MSRHQSTRCGLKVFTLREKGTARSGQHFGKPSLLDAIHPMNQRPLVHLVSTNLLRGA
jgi:hypothetical protein